MTTDDTNAIVRIPLTAYRRAVDIGTYYHAALHAVAAGLRVRAYADPTGAPDREVSAEDAADLMNVDPSLVYVTNWTGP
jgi:hypothetical protein